MTSENSDPGSSNPLQRFLNLFTQGRKRTDTRQYNSRAYERLDTPRKDMIRGIFHLSDQNAREIMIPRVDIVALESDIELQPLVKLVYKAGHSRLPVFEDTIDNIIGIIYAKDLLKILLEKPSRSKKFNLKKLLHEPYFVPETMPLDELLFEFKKRKLHIAIVVDEYGGVAGVVTLEDILEEIVGEINDEFDTETAPEIQRINQNTFEIDPRLPLTDFNETFDLDLPTDDFETIGGYVFDIFGKVPKKDDEVVKDGFTYKIKDINGTVISRIVVKQVRKTR